MLIPVNQSLVDLLLKYGFKETTQKINPDHWNRLQCYGSYNADVKRYFRKGNMTVNLDYIRFEATSNSNSYLPEGKCGIETENLASFLYFSTLPTSDRMYFNKNTDRNPYKIHEFLMREKRYDDDYKDYRKSDAPQKYERYLKELEMVIREVDLIF